MLKKKSVSSSIVALNKKAGHDYFFEQRLQAGLVLQGWEVKSLRAGKVQLVGSYILLKKGEVWLIGVQIQPLPTVSTHFEPDVQRTRKLLLHRKEIDRLIGATEREGYTLIPTQLYWQQGKIKIEIALAKGKKKQDKRAVEKNRDWQRQKSRWLKSK